MAVTMIANCKCPVKDCSTFVSLPMVHGRAGHVIEAVVLVRNMLTREMGISEIQTSSPYYTAHCIEHRKPLMKVQRVKATLSARVRCDVRCQMATGHTCICSCGGRRHGELS